MKKYMIFFSIIEGYGSASKGKVRVMGKKVKNATYLSGNEAKKISEEIQKVKKMIVKNTVSNERSFRSHCMVCSRFCNVFLIYMKNFHNFLLSFDFYHRKSLTCQWLVGWRLMLVDMAGFENIEQAGQVGLEATMQLVGGVDKVQQTIDLEKQRVSLIFASVRC